ncbi:hypothetical protein MAR_010244 [Mya arenaria]|uniref:Uncharacterized protein n=1 Tax=Mya arenaria TaxID=6604 RepID=A0ABY7E951_MYAAR|nr:hypothetical protein MAR_010244 [Mya arenaria]
MEVKEITMYKRVSYGFLFPFLALYSYYIATNHHDIKPLPDYPYFRINTKPFPWGDGRTPLFNYKIIKAGNQEHFGHLKTREEEEEE